jgi:cytochrome c553
MINARRGFLAAAVLLWAGFVHAAGDPVQGRIKASTCMGCHGIPGYTTMYPDYRVPKLGGQNAQYIVSALQEYKSHARTHPTMDAQAATLSDQDMEDIAAWLSTAPHSAEELQ